jgi:exodeoxyribonuclease VII large subunit
VAKVEALPYDDRTVYSVAAFNRGVGQWLTRLPTVWVEGEMTELRRHERWATVFFTLKDPADGSEQRGEFKLRALTIERFGAGAHLASLERLKATLAAEGLFADDRKRSLPLLPRRIGIVTGNDAAAKRDIVTTIRSRFPPASVLVAETYVQGPRAAAEIVAAIGALCEYPDVDVVVLTRGGGSFEDLLPFSDERVVRAVAECPVPVVSAVGHEQDTPLCDLAADVRASTPTAAGKLVVPELAELSGRLDRTRGALARNVRRSLEQDQQRLTRSVERLRARPRLVLEREGQRLERTRERLRLAPALAFERKRAALENSAAKLVALSPVQTLERGYAIVRTDSGNVVTAASDVSTGGHVDVTLADGGFGARVEEVTP